MDAIRIKGAREHNLKNIDLVLPKDRLVAAIATLGLDPEKPNPTTV